MTKGYEHLAEVTELVNMGKEAKLQGLIYDKDSSL